MTSAIILAGGLGTRLRDTVPDLPKPMAPILNKPFLEHQMNFWGAQGVSEWVLSVGYRREVIQDYFGDNYKGVPIRYAVEETPRGTGGGLLLGLAQLTDDAPVLVLNGDTFFDASLSALLSFHAASHATWTMALTRVQEKGRYMGITLDADGVIQSLAAGKDEINRLANAGVYIVEPTKIRALGFSGENKVSLEDELLLPLLAQGRALYGLECGGRFIDIGVPEDYFRAGEILGDYL